MRGGTRNMGEKGATVMRNISLALTAAASLALAAGAAHAEQSWGTKNTTYWSSEATGTYEPGQFVTTTMPTTQPPVTQVQMQTPARQQRMYYQPAHKRVRAPMRVRQQHPNMAPGQPGDQNQPPMRKEQPGQQSK